MMRVIVNPTSRGGAAGALRPELERELARRAVACEIVATQAPGHAVELAREASAAGYSAAVAVGGDGTVHEVANGLLQAQDAGLAGDCALGLVPGGTGNDFVKVIPGTSSRAAAYDTLARGSRYPFDAALVSWPGGREYCLNAFGTGVDVEVVRQIRNRSRTAGALVYVGALVRALRGYRPAHLRVDADGDVLEQRVMMIAVANGSCVGGVFRICPDALPNDGLLDLCLVRELGVLRQPAMAVRIVRGRHGARPEVSFRRVRRVTIERLDGWPLYFQLDGELREPPGVDRLAIEVQPARLQVIAAALPGRAGAPHPQPESIRAS